MSKGSRVVAGSVPVRWDAAYRLVLPAGPPPAGGHPLLLALHGARESGAVFASKLEPDVDVPFARLYPDAPFPLEIRDGEEWRIGHAWYHYTGDRDALDRALEHGERHLLALLDHVLREHALDPRRVALLGYSQGGYLASVAALRRRDRYRALVAISCRVKTESVGAALADARGFPVLVIHGKRDRLTPIEPQERAVADLRAAGVDVRFEPHDRGHGLLAESRSEIVGFLAEHL